MTQYRFVALLLTLALLGAACGSDDGGDSAGGDETVETSTEETGSDDADESQEATANSDEDADTSTVEVSGDGDSDWCGRIRAIAESDEPSPLTFTFLGMTPDELQEQFETNLDVMEEWVEVAPPEIDEDVDVVVDAYRMFVDLGNEAAWDFQAMGTDPAFTEAFEDDALDAAGARVDAYNADVCGVDLAAEATSTPPATAGAGDDLATQLLVALGLPPTLVSESARACMSDALEASGAFSEPIGPGYVPNADQFAALEDAGTGCGIDAFG